MSLSFRPKRLWRPEPVVRPRRTGNDWVQRGDGERDVLIHRYVLVATKAWAAHHDPDECMGLLAGRSMQDAHGPYTLIMGAVLAEGARGSRAHVLADVDAVRQAREILFGRFPASDEVGWWHTHPGYNTFFSSVDRETQATFDEPHLVGLVVDPRLCGEEAFGVYLGPDSIRLEAEGALSLDPGMRLLERAP